VSPSATPSSNPIQISSVSLVEAQDAVIYYGPSGDLDPVTIGVLTYISHNNVWLIRAAAATVSGNHEYK
jgi:hypothetical protein